jgi:hypothetical protein
VYDTSYFGGEQAFQSLWKIGTCLPNVDWDKFPQILAVKKAWDTLLNWPIKERIHPNEDEDRARDVVATIFHANNLPFRPPTTKERLKQAELYELFNSLKVTRSCAAGPVTDDAIGNAFLPSALLGAMHGSAPEGLESHVFKGSAIAHRALKPDACKSLYYKLKDKVAQTIMEEETTILLGKEKAVKAVTLIHDKGFPEDVWKEISDEWLLEVIEAAHHCAKPIVRGYTPMKEAQIPYLLRSNLIQEEEDNQGIIASSAARVLSFRPKLFSVDTAH